MMNNVTKLIFYFFIGLTTLVPSVNAGKERQTIDGVTYVLESDKTPQVIYAEYGGNVIGSISFRKSARCTSLGYILEIKISKRTPRYVLEHLINLSCNQLSALGCSEAHLDSDVENHRLISYNFLSRHGFSRQEKDHSGRDIFADVQPYDFWLDSISEPMIRKLAS